MSRTMVWLLPDDASRERFERAQQRVVELVPDAVVAFRPHLTVISAPLDQAGAELSHEVGPWEAACAVGPVTLKPDDAVQVPDPGDSDYSVWMSFYLPFADAPALQSFRSLAADAMGLSSQPPVRRPHVSIAYTHASGRAKQAAAEAVDHVLGSPVPVRFDRIWEVAYSRASGVAEHMGGWRTVREVQL